MHSDISCLLCPLGSLAYNPLLLPLPLAHHPAGALLPARLALPVIMPRAGPFCENMLHS